ncbi:MAG: hypothetical protein ACXWJD_13870 [Burkholderiaceae bacterium]
MWSRGVKKYWSRHGSVRMPSAESHHVDAASLNRLIRHALM